MITPSDSPSSPSDYAGVAVSGFDIQAPLPDVTGVFNEANMAGGQGVLYPRSERQDQTKALMESVQGFGLDGYDVDAGSAFGWPTNVEPGG
jgi:hypothetical protein